MSTGTLSRCTCTRSGGECRFCEGAREHAERHCAEEITFPGTWKTFTCGKPAVATQEMWVRDGNTDSEFSPICAAHMEENRTYFADPDTDYEVAFDVWAPAG